MKHIDYYGQATHGYLYRKVTAMIRRTRDTLVYGSTYEGYPLMEDKGPFVRRSLDKIIDVMNLSLDRHPRTFAFRVDLNLPVIYRLHSADRLIDYFIASFKSKIAHAVKKARRRNKYAALSSVRYVWAREEATEGRPHWHFLFFLNHDAFRFLGKPGYDRFDDDRRNIINRLIEAWAGALGLEIEGAAGLVNITKNASYLIKANDFETQNEVFRRSSYLAKAATKVRGHRHCFGGSRR